MDYKLLRDLPWAKAGTIWYKRYDRYPEEYLMHILTEDGFLGALAYIFPKATFSEWFEEVDGCWKPENGNSYFYIDTFPDFINTFRWEGCAADDERWRTGNCFKTETDAERAVKQIKALLKEFHKNNP